MIHGYPLSDFELDERTRLAIEELQIAITARYPATTFELARNPEDPDSLLLLATADVDDPDEVGDLVLDRVVELIVEEGIPIHVIPLRTPERIEAERETERRDPLHFRSLARPMHSKMTEFGSDRPGVRLIGRCAKVIIKYDAGLQGANAFAI